MRKYLTILTILLLFFGVKPAFASSVVINEIMTKPNSGEKEWIELFNKTSSNIDLTNWTIEELTASSGNINPHSLPSVILNSNSLCFFELSGLNDTGDTVTLKDSSGNTLDSYTYTTTTRNETFSRSPDGENWTTNNSPTKTSVDCLNLTSASSLSPSPSPTPSPSSTSSPTPTSSTNSIFTISNIPPQIDSTETFNVSVNLSLSDKPNTNFYLKGAFKIKGGTNYFGLTKVGDSWIKNSTKYEEQYKITTNPSGSWSGKIEVQTDISDKGFTGTGNYLFKVARYDPSGSGPTWSNEVTITIDSVSSETFQPADTNQEALPKEDPSHPQTFSNESIVRRANPLQINESSVSSAVTESAQPSESADFQGDKRNNIFIIIGTLMILFGLGFIVYTFIKSRLKFKI